MKGRALVHLTTFDGLLASLRRKLASTSWSSSTPNSEWNKNCSDIRLRVMNLSKYYGGMLKIYTHFNPANSPLASGGLKQKKGGPSRAFTPSA